MSDRILVASAPVVPSVATPTAAPSLAPFDPTPGKKSHYVYILPTLDGTRAKIGWSRTPLMRISGLINTYPEIDLTRSTLIAVDTQRIEPILHTVFGKFRRADERRNDGFTEWFIGDLTDDVIACCQWIANQRGCHYAITRNLAELIQAHRLVYPNAGKIKPRITRDERRIRCHEAIRQATEEALARADEVIGRLDEKVFDGVIHHRGDDYLVRTICRADEPEPWAPHVVLGATAWGEGLLELSFLRLGGENARYYFRVLDRYPFHPINQDEGYELFRIIHQGHRPAEAAPITQAAEVIRRYADTLARIDPSSLRTSLIY